MNWPPFPLSESALGLKGFSLRFTGLKLYQKYRLWEEDICRSCRENRVARHQTSGSSSLRIEFPKLWLPKSFVAHLRSETRRPSKSNMKATTVQLPIRLTKRILLPGASPPRAGGHPKLVIESSGRRCWYAFFRSLRAVISGVLDSSGYEQISLGREVSVVFTSQGPVVYKYGRNSTVDASAAGERNLNARLPKRS